MVDDLPHILVVDDDRRIRNLLQAYLMENGFRISVAASAAEARERMRIMSFDLVLLDIMMPGMDGYQVLGTLKGDPALKEVPVVMISAIGDTDSIVRCLETGAEDYLPKPFHPAILKARVAASHLVPALLARRQNLKLGHCAAPRFAVNRAVACTTVRANACEVRDDCMEPGVDGDGVVAAAQPESDVDGEGVVDAVIAAGGGVAQLADRR